MNSIYERLTLTGDNEGLQFRLDKLRYNQSYDFTFSLRYWLSYQGTNLTNSGVYIFTPDVFQYDSLLYSTIVGVTVQNSLVVSQITMKFYDDESEQYATVKVRLYQKNPVSEWFVRLDNGIPLTNQG